MQNKGFVKVFAVLLTLICVFYLSFSFVTRYQLNKAEEMGEEAGARYLDSIRGEKIYLGAYTFRQCQENEIGLGLDLKGGMNVILEVSVPDVVKSLADNSQDKAFNEAVAQATKEADQSQSDFIKLFVRDFKKISNGRPLSSVFATQKLKDKVRTNSSDAQVESVLREEVKAAVDNSFNVLRTRIDRFGVVQPNIQLLEGQLGRIMVEMPGIKEPERVRKLLQGSANLEFWETYNATEIAPYLSTLDSKLRDAKSGKADTTATEAKDSVEAPAKVAPKNDGASLLAKATKKNKANASDEKALAQAKAEHPLLSVLQLSGAQAGCVVGYAMARDTAAVNAAVNSAVAQNVLPKDLSLKWGVQAADFDKTGQVFELYAIKVTSNDGRAPLEGDVVTTAKDEFDQFGRACVSMSMNTQGARVWAALTKANIGKAIAIVLDGYVYSAPNVNGEINGGNSQITGNFTAETTKDLANVLKSGKMPAPAKIVQEDIVGPSLGQASINQGIISFIFAFIILMIYMCAIYGIIPGMVANGALILNFFFTIGILTSFQAALTMSGIAGIVLTLGMAVDANVLIYERIKEEMRGGKVLKSALGAGYSNAFSAIIDSNVTSIITGIVLFYFGTGPIRGFATTLIIGICASFFTAVFLTRLVYENRLNKDKWLGLSFQTALSSKFLSNTKFKFMSSYKTSFSIFAVCVVVACGSFFVRGLSQSIDFTGGRNFVVQFDKAIEPEQVREALNSSVEDANISVIAIGTDGKTVRISTNYLIDDNSTTADSKVEEVLYTALHKANIVSANTTLEKFIDRDNRAGGSIISSQKVGPSIAKDVTYGAIISVLLSILAIFIYILVRFRNVAFSVGAIVALAVDTVLVIGAYSLLWGIVPFSLEVDQTFIGAVLTIIGYSINDKVVVFDRIREFLKLYPKHDKQDVFNNSLNTTLTRTINTSVSTLIVLLCIFIFGGASIRSFSFAMIIGVVFGTLSSIFIAAPTAYLVMGRKIKEEAVETAE